jgi:hypothetical protein
VYNSIRLKELQVVSEALRKGNHGLGKKKTFSKRLFLVNTWVEWINSTLFQRSFFLRGWEK